MTDKIRDIYIEKVFKSIESILGRAYISIRKELLIRLIKFILLFIVN